MSRGRLHSPEPFTGGSASRLGDGPLGRGVFLTLLMLIYALNYIDRQVVVILQEPIKKEYGLQDWQLGLLTGASISLLYTAAGLPIARWVDRGLNRVRMITVITAAWSIMTAVCGMTQTYVQFLVARMGVGLAEAGYAPAAHSLIADVYDKRRRPLAMGIFAMGIPIGIMSGLAIGGTIAQHYDWRTALLVVGLPGVVIALLFRLLTKEPLRGAAESEGPAQAITPVPFWEAMRTLFGIRAFKHLVIAATASTFVTSGVASWLPSFLIRVHGLSLKEVGLGLGALAGFSGLIGTFFGGWQAAKLGVRGLHMTMIVPIVGLLLAIPLLIVAVLFGTRETVFWMLFPPMTLMTLWSAPSIALKQTLSPVPLRATASAMSVVAANAIGMSLGPITIGLLSDMFAESSGDSATGLRWALVAAACMLVVGAGFWTRMYFALRRMEGADGRMATA